MINAVNHNGPEIAEQIGTTREVVGKAVLANEEAFTIFYFNFTKKGLLNEENIEQMA